MSQSYEYSYSSGTTGGLTGGAVTTGYTVTTEYSSGAGGEYLVGGGSSGLVGGSSGAVLVGSSASGAAQSGTVNQIAQDLLALNAGAGSGVGGVIVSGGGSGGSARYESSASYSVSGGYAAGAGAGIAVGGQVLEASAFSEIEQAIMRANNPISINETEVITVNGQSGVWANRNEVVNWRGVIPITQYLINEDANPEIIRKRTEQQLLYEQEIAIRYLRPPTPPPPGEILIKQEKNIVTPPAPPLVIRQQPPRPETPAPMVIREAPPRPPAAVGSKVITISGKRLPPPPRKVIIERLAPLPSKPQSIIIERWLPYNQTKRRVIFTKSNEADPIIPKPRNVIIQWEAPAVTIKKEFKDLGVIRANPVEYVQRYGAQLKVSGELPSFVREIRPPAGVVLAAEYQVPSLYELEGDVQALSLIDLDREGLAEYRQYVSRYASSSVSYGGGSFSSSSAAYGGAIGLSVNSLIAELFASVDRNASGKISLNEAEKLLLKLNSRLGRRYGEDEARVFFRALDTNGDGFIDFEEFRRALVRQFS